MIQLSTGIISNIPSDDKLIGDSWKLIGFTADVTVWFGASGASEDGWFRGRYNGFWLFVSAAKLLVQVLATYAKLIGRLIPSQVNVNVLTSGPGSH